MVAARAKMLIAIPITMMLALNLREKSAKSPLTTRPLSIAAATPTAASSKKKAPATPNHAPKSIIPSPAMLRIPARDVIRAQRPASTTGVASRSIPCRLAMLKT